MSPKKDLVGLKFGRLLVLEEIQERKKKNQVVWKCVCSCENKNITYVTTHDLNSGNTKSCGCLRSEMTKKRCSENGKYNGECNTKLYRVWRGIKCRCHNKNRKGYKYYGGKGITICEEWYNYFNFKDWALNSGYDENLEDLSIDRINNLGNYEPSNCRWATSAIQNRNKDNNVLIEIDGVTKNAKEWELVSGIKADTIFSRRRKGWVGKDLIGKPYSKYKKNK